MDFSLSSDQQMFCDSVRGFAEKHLAAGALARAHQEEHPWDVSKLIAEQGLMGIAMKEEDGGQGGTLMDAILAIETVAQVCPRSADVIQAGNFGPVRVLAEYGTRDQKDRYLKKILAGESVITVGMTEPEAGSAVTDLTTSAKSDGAGYRINGVKVFQTHASYAEVMLTYVRFGPGVGGIGSVLIPRDSEGFKQGAPSKFLNGEDWVQTYLDNVYVGPENVMLKEGGFKKQIAGFNVERIGNTARSLAFGRYAYEQARQWAMQRKQFGRPLCDFQGLQWKFADMKIKLDAGQLLIYRAVANAVDGIPSADDTAIAKAFCNQAGFDICNDAMQVMGGMGYTQETLVEYCFRKCRGWMIAGGSIEILKNRIAEGIFERSFSQRPPKTGKA
ncbi:MAG TPA: acyl-CoA dehydrogenase family protein [Burkholderiales bacterium]|jgi:alkylation response protein AidB-like acyl-CoA dehydrogenase|nr:acyl-CoA dehydrogenase family protein [Burkholderiales bacterium]